MLPSSSSTPPSSDAASYARTMGSLNALLRESVQHSDPDRMRELAEQIESGAISPVDPSILDMILQPDNEVDTLKKHLAVLQNPISEESSIEEVVTALEEIDFLVERTEMAVALVDLGGLSLVLSCLESPNLNIRSSAARILSTASPHNTEFQTKAMQCCNIVEVLVTRLETERVPQSLNPLLATLTSFASGTAGPDIFDQRVWSVVEQLLQHGEGKVRAKVIYFLEGLLLPPLHLSPEFLLNPGIILSIADSMSIDDFLFTERALHLFKLLLESDKAETFRNLFQDDTVSLLSRVNALVFPTDIDEDMDEFLECREYSDAIRTLLQPTPVSS